MKNTSIQTLEDWVRIEKFIGNDDPDPSKCPVPELLPANVTPVEIFQLVRDQYIVAGLGSVVGINKVALIEVIRLYGDMIDDQVDCFEKGCILAQLEVIRIQEISEQEQKKHEADRKGR